MTAPTTYHLRNESGIEVFTGTISPAPGGGSQPGALLSKDFIFAEQATAGTYSATLALPAGTVVADVLLFSLGAAWAADAAQLTVGDGSQASGFYSTDLSQLVGPYDPANLSIGGNFQTIHGDGDAYGPAGLYGLSGGVDCGPGVRYAADDTLTMTVVTTIAVPPVVPAGEVQLKVIYFAPITAVAATFA